MPFAAVVALTDAVTRSVRVKMLVCIGTTAIAQLLLVLGGVGYLLHLDWGQMAKVVQQRAHADRAQPASSDAPSSCGPSPSGGGPGPQADAEPSRQQPLLINAAPRSDSSTRTDGAVS